MRLIRPMQTCDAGWTAERHAMLMPNSIFAAFGPGFLARVYLELARSPHAVAFVHDGDRRPCGVIAALTDRRAFLVGLLAHSGAALAWAAIRGWVAHSSCRRLLLHIPRYLRRVPGLAAAELLFITVSPECRREGVARALIARTLDEFRARRIARAVVSIETSNTAIAGILERFGFRRIDRFVFADKWNDVLAMNLEGAGT